MDPMDQLVFTGASLGIQVDQSPRAGFTVMEVYSDNRAMPTFHQGNTINANFHTALAFDYFPYVGAFQALDLPWVYEGADDIQVIWPRMDIDINDKLHIVSTEQPASGVAGDPQRLYYCRAAYNPSTYSIEFETPEQEEITWTMTISPDVAASPVSNKVVIGWMQMNATEPDTGQYDNDVILCISEDGVNWDWTDTINVTQWIPPDYNYLPDTTYAERDTLRAYTDMCVYIDYDDVVHVFFSTDGYWAIKGTITYGNGFIWHWDEVNQVYSMVANGWFENGNYDPGAWNTYAQRPSAATDPETGDIYCMYQRYFDPLFYSSTLPFPYMVGDTTDFSATGWPNGEIWMTKSTDNGYSWAEGINITDTNSPDAMPGDCLSELTPCMAPQIVNDQCHIFYILDKDAGTVTQDEGTWTLNDAVYQRIDISNIPSTPLLPPYPMHCDSTGMPGTVVPPSGWELIITATGETGTAPNIFNVTIGGDLYQNFLPAPPPPPQYMCWPQLWELPAWNGPYAEMIQVWDEMNEYEWTLEIDPNGNVMPPISRTTALSWNPATLPETPENWGFFIVDDSGNLIVPDLSQQSSFEVTGESTIFLHIKYGQMILPFEYNLSQYWNLISLPVTPEDNSLEVLFPNATVAYQFAGGTYVQADSLDNGKAYWLYVPNAETVTVEGLPFTDYSVPVNPPWEMLGSVSTPAIPTVDPGNIVVIYNFDQTYYQVPDLVMEPGFGYWVNMTEDVEEFSLNGEALLDGSAKVEDAEIVKKAASLDDWKLTLNLSCDANSFNLSIGCSENVDNTPAPPAPPQYSVWGELYEADWSAGPYFNMIQPSGADISTWLITIDPNGNANPQTSGTVLLAWDAESIPVQGLLSLVNSSGEILVEDMNTVESIEVTGSEIVHYEIVFNTTLGVGSLENAIPADYMLYQNAPNPFNPVTQIKYYLLETGDVKVTVFNIMGEQVAILAEETQNQGFHVVNFEAANLTSGVYFYRIEAGDFTDFKKMVLIK